VADGNANPGATNGEPLSRYEVLNKIGEGGMGEVFLARDTTLERRVALKFLPEQLQEDETARQRFLLEAKSAAALDHPYICKIYEIGDLDGRSFIAMEYVEGETLKRRLQNGAMPTDEAVRLATEIVEALETAHAAGIVHRDLKPDNIMITESEHVKVMDFGIARRMEAPEGKETRSETAARLTGTGVLIGTPAYMSPEQMRAEQVDQRSDTFSLGVVLYEMLTGVHPFSKNTAIDTIAAILGEAPPPLSRHQPALPDLLEHVVAKMTAKSPEDRYQQVREVRIDLRRVREQSGEGTTAAREQRPTGRRPSWTRPGGGAVAVLALFVLALLVGTAWWINSMIPAGPQSVAFLPLINSSDDPLENNYIAAGIHEAVILRMERAGLRVTPRETTLLFSVTDEPELMARVLAAARLLEVHAVLFGTFEIDDEDQIFVELELVEVESGDQLWVDEFEVPYEEIFALYTDIALATAGSLSGELTGEDREALAAQESQFFGAFDDYAQGAYYLWEGTAEGTDLAVGYFNRALDQDAGLARAHVALGAAKVQRYYDFGGAGEDLIEAQAHYRDALDLDESSMRARRGLIMANYLLGEPAEVNLKLGLDAQRLGRRDDVGTLLTRAAAYQSGGLLEFAAPLIRAALDIDPLNQESHYWLAWASWDVEGDEAVEAADEYFRLFGDDAGIHELVAYHHHIFGSPEIALHHYQRAMELGGSTGAPSASALDAFLFGGMLFEQRGDDSGADEVWRRGKELAQQMRTTAPDSPRLGLLLASFHAVLGEEASATRLEDEFLIPPKIPLWEVSILAIVHAKQGHTERAVELLQRTVPLGLDFALVWDWFTMAGVPFPDTEEFEQLLADIDAQHQRRVEAYGPGAEAGRRP